MNTSYFNEPMETLSRDEMTSLQDARLRKICEHIFASGNSWWREHFAKAGINAAADVGGLADLERLPFMKKDDLRENYPLGLCCVARDRIEEMHMSSGSTGTPVVMPYTIADLEQWSECMARCYTMAGARRGDVCQITAGFGLFNGGFGLYYGARRAGLFVVPTGPGNTARQIRLAKDLKSRILTGVVSYTVRIMEVLAEQGETLPDLKIGIFGSETFSESMKKRLRSGLGIESFDIYGMTESGGVGTLGMDCGAHAGIHPWEDHYIIEIIDPATGGAVPDGEPGEIVVTSLTREALPIIRFRTGDLSRILSREKCACGRTHLRLAPIEGRIDDMLIIAGVNFFPRQVEETLMKIPGVLPNYQMIVRDDNGIKRLRVNVEAEGGVTGHAVAKALKEALGFTPEGDAFPAGTLPRSEGKAKRVIFE